MFFVFINLMFYVICVHNFYKYHPKQFKYIFMYRFFDRSRENLARGAGRDYSRDSLGLRDGSEMVVSDVCVKGKQTF